MYAVPRVKMRVYIGAVRLMLFTVCLSCEINCLSFSCCFRRLIVWLILQHISLSVLHYYRSSHCAQAMLSNLRSAAMAESMKRTHSLLGKSNGQYCTIDSCCPDLLCFDPCHTHASVFLFQLRSLACWWLRNTIRYVSVVGSGLRDR